MQNDGDVEEKSVRTPEVTHQDIEHETSTPATVDEAAAPAASDLVVAELDSEPKPKTRSGDAYASLPAGIKFLFLGAITTVAFAGLYQIKGLFGPIFFALTLVLTVRPLHRWLIKKRLPTWLSAIATLTTLTCTLLSIVALMAWSLAGLPSVVKSYIPAFQSAVDSILKFVQEQGFATDQIVSEVLAKLNFSQALTTVMSAAGTLTSVGSFLTIIALASLFLTVDTLTMNVRAKIVENHDSLLYEALASFEGRVRQYWLVSTVFGLIVAVVNGIVLYSLDVPMPVAWALFSFITNYIPNVGFVLGVIPPALMGALDSGWLTGVWVIVAYSLINAIIQGIFQPKFTGEAVGLSTSVTFMSLLFWTVAIGPIGAILAVPLTLFMKAILIDSSAKTRWMGAFLIPENEAERQAEEGFFNETSPRPDTLFDVVAEDPEEGEKEGKKVASSLKELSLRKKSARTERK